MKKICLIMGVIACVCATNAYAVRDGNGGITAGAETQQYKVKSVKKATAWRCDPNSSPGCGRSDCEVIGRDPICCKDNQGKPCNYYAEFVVSVETESSQQMNASRASKVMVPQKVVYKEIYFDDSVDTIEE